MPAYPPEAWKRLGRLLKSRRVHLDPAYRNRQAFCDQTRVNYKLIQEIENADRDTFTDESFALFETAYQLAPGAILRALAGGPLDPRDDETKPPAPHDPGAEDGADAFDLDSFVPQTPAEKALMAIYAATKVERERHQRVERKLEDLQARLDRLEPKEAERNFDQERKGA